MRRIDLPSTQDRLPLPRSAPHNSQPALQHRKWVLKSGSPATGMVQSAGSRCEAPRLHSSAVSVGAFTNVYVEQLRRITQHTL